ncbi:MAG: 30S ribosomal protein S8 [Betaproteobacteria bacterium]|nr:30S ribosomal protein S8 [Betaproteobacteria bacterium]
MSMSDPVADMLARVRNALAVGHQSVLCSNSRLNAAILEVMRTEGYIRGAKPSEDGRGLVVALKYYAGRPAIESIRRVSRPGLRSYAGSSAIRPVLNGLGIAIVSTSQGVMSDAEARKRGIGGEILCAIS